MAYKQNAVPATVKSYSPTLKDNLMESKSAAIASRKADLNIKPVITTKTARTFTK